MKLFLVMIITLIAGTVCVAQFDKTVTFDEKNASMEKITKIIWQQTEIPVFYDDAVIIKPITKKAKKMPVLKLIEYICRINQCRYDTSDNLITIYKVESRDSLKKTTEKIIINGKVSDQNGNALDGASIIVKGTTQGTTTDINGNFTLPVVDENAVLEITFVGYEKQIIKIKEQGYYIECKLEETPAGLMDLTVIANTGYQKLSKERATGSFSIINNELLNRGVNGDINDMLRNKASGVEFQPNATDRSKELAFKIRGESTIFSPTAPLVVLEDFRYDGDIRNINADDVVNTSVLKDAASASIHGAYSGNGVVILSTRKTKRNTPLHTEFQMNTTVSEKYNAFNDPNYMDADNFINAEKFLFSNGYLDNILNNNSRLAVTPAVSIFVNRRLGSLSQADADNQLDVLRNYDVRKEFNKHFFQRSVNQQYSLAVSRGGPRGAISFTTGYKKTQGLLTRNSFERFNIGFNNIFYPGPRLELTTKFLFTDSKTTNNNGGPGSVTMGNRKIYPYAQFTNDDGSDAIVVRDISQSFKNDTAAAVDWNSRPLQDLRAANNITRLNDIWINFGAQYKLYKGLNIEGKFQVEKQQSNTRNLQTEEQYFTRNLINLYYNPIAAGDRNYGIPRGAIFDESQSSLTSFRSRVQINLDTNFGQHSIAAIAGRETGSVTNDESIKRLYGFNTTQITNSGNLDYKTLLPIFMGLRPKSMIPNIDHSQTTKDETISWYLNASYSYSRRYIFSVSSRVDQANIFGSTFNKKNILLWSAGAAWKISDEYFYTLYWLRDLKIRATYGCNGNVNRSVPALMSIDLLPVNSLGLSPASINNPNNPYLGWERSNMLNIAIDFASIKNRVTGSIEFYIKKSDNLMEMHRVAPSAGLAAQGMRGYMANGAGMKSHGVDIEINSNNLIGDLKWKTRFLFGYNTNKITHYSDTFPGAMVAQSGGGSYGTITPVTGKSLHHLFSYPWAGLDPNEGDPQGMIDNKVSKDYSALLGLPIDKLIQHGPALPTFTGVITNTFTYKRLTLMYNIAFRLGYYFRAPSISYYALFNSGSMHKDYTRRWKEPGDELITNVPSMKYVNNTARDMFYNNASINVHKAGNVRFQDIKLTYEINKTGWRNIPATNIQLYFYINNIGLLWKANKIGLDPDYINGYHTPRSYTIGLKADLK